MRYAPFTEKVLALIRAIPYGRVCTYGMLARLAGSPRGARQVVRILHTLTEKEGLPWQRVVNREGRIALRPMQGFEEQKALLEREGISVDAEGRMDIETYLWRPD